MYILDITSTCSSPGLANILSIIKTVLNLIQIIGPIIAIVGITIHVIKMMTNPDDKKAPVGLKNSIIALLALFLIPLVINIMMQTIAVSTDTFQLAECWVNAEEAKKETNGSDYIPTNKKPASSPQASQDDYEVGKTASTNSSSSSTSSTTSSSTQTQLSEISKSILFQLTLQKNRRF